MRFADLRLVAYGGFQGRVPAFPAREQDFHIVLGANEAGKSTTLRALTALLFGFSHHVKDDYRFDGRDLRVGGVLENADGRLCAIRKRGRVRTLVDEQDAPLPDDCQAPYLGGVQQHFYEMVFGLGHERLREGGQELAQNRGDLTRSLFTAGAGVAGLRSILASLQAEAEALFKARGQNPLINVALKEYHDASLAVKNASVGATDWKRLFDQLTRAQQQQTGRNAEVQQCSQEISRLDRIQHNLPQLAQRSVLLDKLAELLAIPDVQKAQVQRRLHAQQQAREAAQAFARAKAEVSRLAGELAGLQVDDKLLAGAEEVQQLRDERASLLSVLDDLPKRQGEILQIESRIGSLREDAALKAKAKGKYAPLPGSPERANLRALVGEHRSLSEARQRLEDDLREARLKLSREQQAVATLPPEVDTAALQEAVDAVTDEGPLEKQLQQAQAELAQREEALAILAAALHPWRMEPEALVGLALPSRATVQQYADRLDDLDGQLADAQRKVAETTAEAEDIRAELDALAAGAEVATPEAIHDSRQIRDEGWRLLRRAFVDGDEDVATEARAYDARLPLPEAYEHRVAEADALADRRHAEAERIARHEDATLRLSKAEKRVARLKRTLGRLQKQRKEVFAEWTAEWSALDGEPQSPAEMRAWLEARERVMEANQDLIAARERVERLERGIAEAKELLAAGLESTGLPRADQPAALAALLREARKQIKTTAEVAGDRRGIFDRMRALEESIAASEDRLKDNEVDSKDWRKRWGTAVKAIQRGTDATPAEVESVIARIEEIEKLGVEQEQLAGRIEEMETFIRTYQERVDTVVMALAPHLTTVDALEAVAALGTALDSALKARDRREQLNKEITRQEEAIRDADQDAQKAAAELKALCDELACEDEAALQRTEEQAETKVGLRDDLGRLEQNLIESNRGHSLDDIVAEARDVDGDALPGQLTTLRERLEALQGEQRQVLEEVGRLGAELARMDGSDHAVLASQTAEDKLAAIEGASARYLRAETARWLLGRSIESYQKSNQGPLLARAGALFGVLTLGSFLDLTVEYLDSGAVLLGVRPDNTTLHVDDMSDGTRDQLFLALRLAAIERHVELQGPLPVVLDDILVNFDDERASATLRALAELSRRTQVLLLTHHPHLVGLAEKCLGKDIVALQSL